MKKLRLDIDGLLVDEFLHHLICSLLAVSLRLLNNAPNFPHKELSTLEYLPILAIVAVLTHETKDRELLSKAAESDLLSLTIKHNLIKNIEKIASCLWVID